MHTADRPKAPFPIVVILGTLFLAVLLITMARQLKPIENIKDDISSTPESVYIEDMSSFIRSASSQDLPKTFHFKKLIFATGKTEFGSEGDGELNFLSSFMKRFPSVVISINGHSEETGDSEENILLSENRAMLIREELIGRGVEPSRIKAQGQDSATGTQLTVQILKK
jgi:outer membrane protein OmpA-like peptidoglycan-associated protein